jgi:hypothetical protein
VSICSGCPNEEALPVALPAKLDESDQCCDESCSIKVCVRPFVAVCLHCANESQNKVQVQHTQESALKVPYKKCCPTKCRSQICVPPFVELCSGCAEGSALLVQ